MRVFKDVPFGQRDSAALCAARDSAAHIQDAGTKVFSRKDKRPLLRPSLGFEFFDQFF
jgi:hypothetical protein